MKRIIQLAVGLLAVATVPMAAQLVVPELTYDVQIEPLKLPGNLSFGEVAGSASNSKGDGFVYTRTGHPTISLASARPFAHGGSRLFRFDKTGKYVGEIGQGSYAMLFAEKVKVDPQDNIWVVDQMSNTVMEFDTEGRLVRAGFTEAACWLEAKSVTPPEPRRFVHTVCLIRHLDRLPGELREPFVDAVLERAGDPLVLDYVRLNMTARA
jgi:hypothetical protein